MTSPAVAAANDTVTSYTLGKSVAWATREERLEGTIMASEFGLFIGFGPAKPGREQQALEVFMEAQQYNERLKQSGDVESYESVLLEPHGGDLGGFTLLRGTPAKLNRLRSEDEEFQRLITRGGLVVENIGVVGAVIGDGIRRQVTTFEQAVRSLQPATTGAR